MVNPDPILVDCEGSGHDGHALSGRVMCAMCGQWVDIAVRIDIEQRTGWIRQHIAVDHQRRDILAMIERGDFA